MERMNSYQASRDSIKHYLHFSMISHLLITMMMFKEYLKIMIDISCNIIVISCLNGWINTNHKLHHGLQHFPLYMILLMIILHNNA